MPCVSKEPLLNISEGSGAAAFLSVLPEKDYVGLLRQGL